MLRNSLTITQKKIILVSMLKELDYLFCSNSVSKSWLNDKFEEVKLELTAFLGEEICWEVFVEGKQEVVSFSQKSTFVEDFLKVNDECGFI